MAGDDPKIRIARRARLELQRGDVVNLGIGIPTLVAELITPEDGIHLHSENGILGVGPTPPPDEIDTDLVNASKQPVTILPGASFFDSATSFAMIRGGHIDVALLGALQVDVRGNLANWIVPGRPILGVGGAMDLAAGARRVVALMTHAADGKPKFVAELTLPLTAPGCVDTGVTELAVFKIRADGAELIEIAPDTTLDEVRRLTSAPFTVSPSLGVHQGCVPVAVG